MPKLTVNVQVKLSENEAEYLDIIQEKYCIKRCNFIRQAILEKMQRDIPKLRKEKKIKNAPRWVYNN